MSKLNKHLIYYLTNYVKMDLNLLAFCSSGVSSRDTYPSTESLQTDKYDHWQEGFDDVYPSLALHQCPRKVPPRQQNEQEIH